MKLLIVDADRDMVAMLKLKHISAISGRKSNLIPATLATF
jgi:hypothetical protein